MSPQPPSMSDRDGKIWMDGQMVDWRDAKIHVLTHTLHYGCGAFEGVRAYNTAQGTAIYRLQEHTERLFNSAKILRMKIPFTKEEVNQAQIEVVRANKLESCYIRPLTWIGDKKLGVSPRGNTIHLMVAAWPWGAYLGEDGLAKGGAIAYYANGSKALAKEYLEVHRAGTSAVLRDFKELEIHASRKPSKTKLLNQNKGQAEMVKAFVEALRSGTATPIPFAEIYASTLSTFKILESIRTGGAVTLEW